MSSASKLHNGQSDEQWEVLTADWWKTVYNSVSWSYPASQGAPARPPTKRNPLLRISSANRALKSRIAKYLRSDHNSDVVRDELSVDLPGVKAAEEGVATYEMHVGFSMLDRLLDTMSVGWTSDEPSFYDAEQSSKGCGEQWDDRVEALLGEFFERIPEDEALFAELAPEEVEESLKQLSPLWDSCLSDTSIIELARSADIIDLTDSDLSADSDPLPVTPKPRTFSLSALSPGSIKPLNATASSFVPSPAKFTSFRSPSFSPSPSPSPPALDIVNFPTLRQTILPMSRKDDHDGKPKWSTKRQNSVVPSFLTEKTEKAESRRSRTRQMVDKMRSAGDARKPDSDFISMSDESQTAENGLKPVAEANSSSSKGNKRRPRRGRESISTVSTDNNSMRSSSAEGSVDQFSPPPNPRPQVPRQPPKHSKRALSVNMRPPITAPTPPTPAFSSPAASVSSFGGPVTPGPFGMPYPPPQHQPPHPAAFMPMNGRNAPYPPPFPFPYYNGMPAAGLMPPPQPPFGNSYSAQYPPYNAYGKGVGVITGASGIRHASW